MYSFTLALHWPGGNSQRLSFDCDMSIEIPVFHLCVEEVFLVVMENQCPSWKAGFNFTTLKTKQNKQKSIFMREDLHSQTH